MNQNFHANSEELPKTFGCSYLKIFRLEVISVTKYSFNVLRRKYDFVTCCSNPAQYQIR